MKKTLIALAVLGAFGAAQAQSNVTIYGKLQPSYDFIDTGAGKVTDMASNNSRLGFKGTEDLGGGLKAIFQIESQVDLVNRGDNDGDASLARRDSWVGVAGGFGSLTFGNHQTAYVIPAASYDFFADSLGDYNNIMGSVGKSAADGFGSDDIFNSRVRKSAYYTSPVMGGVQVYASYAMDSKHEDGTAGTGGDTDVLAIAASYTNGPLKVLAAYEQQKAGGDDKLTAMKLGAGYKLPMGTQINAIVEQLDQKDALDIQHLYIGASHPVTANLSVMANLMWASENDDGANDSGAKGYAIGAQYNFSKRTNVLAVYSVVDNDDAGTYGMDSGYAPTAAGEKVSGFSVRLQHNF